MKSSGCFRACNVDFNPRSHERSDEGFFVKLGFDDISIHAPTRGATNEGKTKEAKEAFQSTLPREERQSCSLIYGAFHHFNPRSHERSDVDLDSISLDIAISIHAPTRGATAILHKKFVYFYTIPTINI